MVGIESERAMEMLVGAWQTLGPRSETVLLLYAPSVPERGVHIGIVRGERERAIEHGDRVENRATALRHECFRAHQQLVRLDLARRNRRGARRPARRT